MSNIRYWTWQTWAIVTGLILIFAGWVPDILDTQRARSELRAHLALPTTAELWHVGYVELDRNAQGHLVVFTDAHAETSFEGRFKVALRDRDTGRHAFTPQWSAWLDYQGNADGTRYRQPETFQWWADVPDFIEPPARNWAMETCWQARIEDPTLGVVELQPVCATSLIDSDQPRMMAPGP